MHLATTMQPAARAASPVAPAAEPCELAFVVSRAELQRCENATPSAAPESALDSGPTATPGPPALDPALAANLQHLLDEMVADSYIPGAVLSVSLPGYAPWTGASGLAERDSQVAMTPTTPVRIASVSKMFTAVVVLQLVEEGVLALDAPLATWLPDSVPNARSITIRHLLQHTSGLYDYLEDRDIVEQMRRDPGREWQPQELVDYATSFPSGTLGRWDYSSTNYVLLGMVVEKATSETLAQQIRERIFEPLGMTDAAFLPQESAPEGLAHGYASNTDITDASMSFAFATGNLAMTAEDLQRFGRALFAGDLLRAETREVMLQRFVSGRGQYEMPDLAYGLGVMRNRLPLGPAPDGRDRAAEANLVLGHIGGYGGFRSAIWYAPNSDLVIAVGLNQSLADPNDLAADVLDQLLTAMGR
jgi:D-alanyl-D-alanine carboxypeptidase